MRCKFFLSVLLFLHWFGLAAAWLSWDDSRDCRLYGWMVCCRCTGCALAYFRTVLKTFICTEFNAAFHRLTHTALLTASLSLSSCALLLLHRGWTERFVCVYLIFFFCRYIFCLLLFGFRPERPSFGFRMRVGFISGTSNEMQPNRPCGFGTMAESGKNNKIYLREWSAFFSSAICHQPRKQHKKTKKKLHVAEATFPM